MVYAVKGSGMSGANPICMKILPRSELLLLLRGQYRLSHHVSSLGYFPGKMCAFDYSLVHEDRRVRVLHVKDHAVDLLWVSNRMCKGEHLDSVNNYLLAKLIRGHKGPALLNVSKSSPRVEQRRTYTINPGAFAVVVAEAGLTPGVNTVEASSALRASVVIDHLGTRVRHGRWQTVSNVVCAEV